MSELSDTISDYIWQEAASYAMKSNCNPCFPYITYIYSLMLYSVRWELVSFGMYNIVQRSYPATVRKVAKMTGHSDVDINSLVDLFYKSIDSIEKTAPAIDTRLGISKALYVATAFDNEDHHLRYPTEEEEYLFYVSLEDIAPIVHSQLSQSQSSNICADAEFISFSLWSYVYLFVEKTNKPMKLYYATFLYGVLLYSVKPLLATNGRYDAVINSFYADAKKALTFDDMPDDERDLLIHYFCNLLDCLDQNCPDLSLRSGISEILSIAHEFISGNPESSSVNYTPSAFEVSSFFDIVRGLNPFLQNYFEHRDEIVSPKSIPVRNASPTVTPQQKAPSGNEPMNEGRSLALLIGTISFILGVGIYCILH